MLSKSIVEFMSDPSVSPVVDALLVAQIVFNSRFITSNDPEYRKVLRTMHKLAYEDDVLDSMWFQGTNQRVWWLKARLR